MEQKLQHVYKIGFSNQLKWFFKIAFSMEMFLSNIYFYGETMIFIFSIDSMRKFMMGSFLPPMSTRNFLRSLSWDFLFV